MKRIMVLLTSILMSCISFSQVQIIAHRGASWLAPENTITSSKLAWEKGADAVEVDIWLSKDNRVICSHDGNTKRITGQDLKISETSSKVLRKLDAGSFKDAKFKGEKLPFLEEIVKKVPPGKELVVEIKCGSEILPYLQKIIRRYEKNRQFVFICFDFKTITATKKTFPEKKCYWLCSNRELLENTFDSVPGSGLNGISLGYAIINEDIMKKAVSLNLEVFSWTVDDPAEAQRLIALGVKGITTNRPGWLEEEAGIR